MTEPCPKRLLSIDLSGRGFGYAIFDCPTLVDWGGRRVKGDKNVESIGRIKDLLDWYQPGLVVLEDCEAAGSRRAPRIRELSREIRRMAGSMGIEVALVAWEVVRGRWGRSPRANKDQVAANVANLFAGIKRHLPPRRKIWMSEDERMNLFDAVALALTACRCRQPTLL